MDEVPLKLIQASVHCVLEFTERPFVLLDERFQLPLLGDDFGDGFSLFELLLLFLEAFDLLMLRFEHPEKLVALGPERTVNVVLEAGLMRFAKEAHALEALHVDVLLLLRDAPGGDSVVSVLLGLEDV